MVTFVLFAAVLTGYFSSLNAQSIFYGDTFICNECKPGDNIICNTNEDCTLECGNGCDGVIINAKRATSLSIINCINCDKMTIYCPQKHNEAAYNMDNMCSIQLSNDINHIHIYAQESFNDFSVVQSKSTNYNILTSYIHCGDLNMIEFQCILSSNGHSCINPTDICQSYRMPTISPTPSPTTITSPPTMIPTTQIISAIIASNTNTSKDTDMDTDLDLDMEKEQMDSTQIINGIVDDMNDQNETIGLFSDTHNNNAHYIMLIVGLCIIWGSFFCCFIIMYYHREKKQQLNKAVHIMERPMSPSYHPSKSHPTKSSIGNKNNNQNQNHNHEHSLSTAPPTNKLKLQHSQQQSRTHTECNELYKVKGVSNMIQVNLNQKNKSMSEMNDESQLQINDNKNEEESSVNHIMDVIIHAAAAAVSPVASPRIDRLSPRMDFIRSPRLSPRPYFYDKHCGNITPYAHASANVYISPRKGMSPRVRRGISIISPRRSRLMLNDASSNPMSINTVNTAEAVEIKFPVEVKKIPCYTKQILIKKQKQSEEKQMQSQLQQKDELQIIQMNETPQFEDDMDINLDVIHKNVEIEDEGSLDSRYVLKISRDEDKEEEDSGDDINNEMSDDNITEIQTEGGKSPINTNVKRINAHNALCAMNKMSVFWYSEAPPPPPPSLMNNANHSYMNSMHSHSLHNMHVQALNSPSRHYRVKYSLGIQQDIKNCMSVPGAVAEKKKFAFDDKSTEKMLNSHSHSHSQISHHDPSNNNNNNNNISPSSQSQSQSHSQQYSLLKPPMSPCQSFPINPNNKYEHNGSVAHTGRYYVPNAPISHSTYSQKYAASSSMQHHYRNNYYQQSVVSVTPQPMPHLTYLSFPHSRPRIYSDPTFPAKQSL